MVSIVVGHSEYRVASGTCIYVRLTEESGGEKNRLCHWRGKDKKVKGRGVIGEKERWTNKVFYDC